MNKITLLISTILFTLYINAQCAEPTNVRIDNEWNDIFILWDTNGEDTWDIEYGEMGFIPTGIPTTEDLSDNYWFFLFDLEHTTYDFYVRADCGAEQSDWVGPFTFYNYCSDSMVYEYFEDEFLPPCWEQANEGSPSTEPFGFGQGSWEQSNFANTGSSLSAKINLYGTEVNDWLITPLMEAAIPIREDIFWIWTQYTIALTQHNSSDVAQLGSDDQIQLVYSLDYGLTWHIVQSWDNSSTISNTGETLDFSTEVSTDSNWLLMAFWVSSGVVNDTEDVDFFIDFANFSYEGSGAIDELSSKGFSYYPNPTVNTINFSAKEKIDEIVIYNNLGQKLKQVAVNALNNQLDISELENGIYYMQVRIGNTLGVVPLVKK